MDLAARLERVFLRPIYLRLDILKRENEHAMALIDDIKTAGEALQAAQDTLRSEIDQLTTNVASTTAFINELKAQGGGASDADLQTALGFLQAESAAVGTASAGVQAANAALAGELPTPQAPPSDVSTP